MESSVARWVLGIGGASMVVVAIVIRHDLLCGGLLVAGVGVMLAAFVGPNLKRFKLDKGGVNIETRDTDERNAAAELADRTSTLEDYAASIDSDDLAPPGPSDVDAMVIGGLNLAAGEIALQAIFDREAAEGPLSGCDMRLYLYDEDEKMLTSALGDDSSDTRWAVGTGATGTAFQRRQYVVATGVDAWNDTYGLNAEQQQRYRSLVAVASVPVFNSAGTVIAVVTASTTDLDSQLSTEAGELALVGVSLLTSRVLIELLQWFDDGR